MNLSGINVGWDLDGVCYDFTGAFRRLLENNFGYESSFFPETITWDHYQNHWGLLPDDFYGFCKQGAAFHSFYSGGDVIPGAVEAMRSISERGGRNIVISAREWAVSDGVYEITENWLRDNGFLFDELYLSHDKTLVPTDFFIEDNPHNVDMLRRSGSKAYLYSQPWNIHETDVFRIDTHEEFVDRILEEISNE